MRSSIVRINTLVSYASQIYLIIISLIVLPLYLKYMGTEAYGLVGFFSMLQGLFALLDLGLTPTVSRQSAQFNAGVIDDLNFRKLFRALSIIFLTIAFIGAFLIFTLNDYIAGKWLNFTHLKVSDVLFCLNTMAVAVALRWIGGLYKGVIIGFERLVWLGIFNIIINSLRFFGVLVYMYYTGFTIINFFVYQLIISILEEVFLLQKIYNLLPKVAFTQIGWSLRPLKSVISFSMTIAVTSAIWVLMTQLDKLILSGILTLKEYGYYTLAVLAAGGILQIGGPVANVVMPRLTILYAENKYSEMRKFYITATRFVTAIIVTIGLVLAIYAESVLMIWTNNPEVVQHAKTILQLFCIGNCLLVLAAFPYYLQYAKGNLKYHLIGNILSVILLVPLLIVAAQKFGGVGAGWVWLMTQIVFLFLWCAYVHTKIEKGINKEWYMSFIPSLITVSAFLLLVKVIYVYTGYKIIDILVLFIISCTAVLISMVSSAEMRRTLIAKVKSIL